MIHNSTPVPKVNGQVDRDRVRRDIDLAQTINRLFGVAYEYGRSYPCPIHGGDGDNFIMYEYHHGDRMPVAICYSQCGRVNVIDAAGLYLFRHGWTGTGDQFKDAINLLYDERSVQPAKPVQRVVVPKPKPRGDWKTIDQISQDDIARWHEAYRDDVYAYWQMKRGLSEETIEFFVLGVDDINTAGQFRRFAIPIFDGPNLVNIKQRLTDDEMDWRSQRRSSVIASLWRERYPQAQTEDDVVLMARRDRVRIPAAPDKYMNYMGGQAALFNLEPALIRSHGQKVLIVEGEPDAMAGWQAGLPIITVTNGSLAWQDHMTLAITGVPDVYVCMDPDAAGNDGVRKLLGRIRRAQHIPMPRGVKDFDEYVLSEGPDYFQMAMGDRQHVCY